MKLFSIAMFAYHFLPGKNSLNFIALNKNPFCISFFTWKKFSQFYCFEYFWGGGGIMYGHTVIIFLLNISIILFIIH